MVHRFQVFLLHLIDIDGRVVTRGQGKGQAADNQLHCVASVGRERDPITQASTWQRLKTQWDQHRFR
jgi:hypothetical protein